MKKVLNFVIILFLSFSLMSFGLVSNPKHSEKQSVVKTSKNFKIISTKELTIKISDVVNEDIEDEKPEVKTVFSVLSSFFNTVFSLVSKFFKL